MSATKSGHRFEWAIPAGLVLLSIVPAIAGTMKVAGIVGNAPVTAENARFIAMPLPILLHILAAIPFSLLGAFQFASSFRRRNRKWHKAAGRIIGVAGIVVAVSGLHMTLTYPWPAVDGVAVYMERLVFGVAMLVSIGLGLDAVRRRDFTAHGEWMMRGYAIGMGAGTQVLTHLPWFILVGEPTETPRAVLMGAGWVINVMVTEWVIRRQRGASGSRVASTIYARQWSTG